VAQSTIRVAAGAGVVAASLLIAGPNPAHAIADKHGLGPHSVYEDRNDRPNGPSNRRNSGGLSWAKDVSNTAGGVKDPKPSTAPPLMDLGTGGSDLDDLAVAESIAPEGPMALRSAAVAEEPTGVNAAGAAPRAGAAPQAGSGYAFSPAASFRSPRVVIGNGRSPGPHDASRPARPVLRDSSLGAQVPDVLPAVPEAIEINIVPLPPPLPPVERIRPSGLVVGEFGTATVDTTTDPLAGVVGLILIPAVGAVLGYRQARAAQSLRESTRT